MSDSLWPLGLYSPWNSPGPNTGVSSLSLPQGLFPTQGSNQDLPHCRWILYQLSLKGSPRILEWVAYPFSSRSSWPRNQTGVSCIADGFFTSWVTREAQYLHRFHELECVDFCRVIILTTLERDWEREANPKIWHNCSSNKGWKVKIKHSDLNCSTSVFSRFPLHV